MQSVGLGLYELVSRSFVMMNVKYDSKLEIDGLLLVVLLVVLLTVSALLAKVLL